MIAAPDLKHWIKWMMTGRFLTRGTKGTSTEMALSVLAFNMVRSINLGQSR
ncbi:hypothetical protein SAMN02927914_01483 [Mesorhizobium qingshengii]|jgi:hypothetical protein|uniref:Transposase DDE domain-containing protein n=1 Tax=Mesorhizobium qingshengii TaxID=1165689 RepID=A0A1G5WN71_9HYPH|nr:hypothetical protein SAMN02927914_01483 [Mesorhizobium qingshengii]